MIFGVVSCFVFTCLRPVMENWLHPKADSTITIPGDEWSTEAETEEKKEPAKEEPKQEAGACFGRGTTGIRYSKKTGIRIIGLSDAPE